MRATNPAADAITLDMLDDLRERIRRKSKLKGCQADAVSLHQVQALIDLRPESA